MKKNLSYTQTRDERLDKILNWGEKSRKTKFEMRNIFSSLNIIIIIIITHYIFLNTFLFLF